MNDTGNDRMHELAVTENILDTAIKYAKQAGAERVTDIYLVIGELSSIIDESIQFYWDILSENTICQGAKLHFERIKLHLECQNCHHIYQVDNVLVPCPKCNSYKTKIHKGDEFRLESIDIAMMPSPHNLQKS